ESVARSRATVSIGPKAERGHSLCGRNSPNGINGILARSLRLDIGRPNDLCPFFALVGDELGEVGGRAPKRYAAKFGKPCLRRGIGKRRINPVVELVNNLRRCGLGKTNAVPRTRIIPRYEFAYARHFRKPFPSRSGRHSERTQLVAPDVTDRA